MKYCWKKIFMGLYCI